MKLSKTALLVLGIGIFILGFAVLFTMYSGQSGEREQLNSRMATTQGLLPELIAEKDDLTGQVAQWETELDKLRVALDKSEGRFPKSIESIEYDEIFFKMASDCGLMIMELTAVEPWDENVKGTDITYAVGTAEVKVQNTELTPTTVGGFEVYADETVDKVLEFIHLLAASDDFNVSTIRLVTIENLDAPDENTLESAETDAAKRDLAPEATIQLLIYGFPR
jgi:hypothetical protein